MVLERLRRSECGHHRVPCELFDRSSGSLDLGAHRVVEALETGARPFGILVACGRGRVDEIRKQDRRELALGMVGHGPSLA
jgi:hypothetical protein